MSWDAVGAIAELAAAIGVIITLAYLALQIRHNSELLDQNIKDSRRAAVSTATSSMREIRNTFINDGEFAELILKARADSSSLSEVEQLRYDAFNQNFLEALSEVYAQTKLSGLAPEIWETQGLGLMRRQLDSAGGRLNWQYIRKSFPEEFRKEIDLALMHGVP